MIKISMLDFEVKKSTFSACALMTIFCLLALFVPFIIWILLIIFGGLGLYLGYDIFIKDKFKNEKVKKS